MRLCRIQNTDVVDRSIDANRVVGTLARVAIERGRAPASPARLMVRAESALASLLWLLSPSRGSSDTSPNAGTSASTVAELASPARRIHGELVGLSHRIASSTVWKMAQHRLSRTAEV